MNRYRLWSLLLLALVPGCGESHRSEDSGVPDSGIPDGTDSGADVDAGTDAGREPCDTPGAMRTAPCGACGVVSQRCGDDHVWTNASACVGELACIAGSNETRATAACGEETRICLESCTWTDWSQTTPDRDCTAGQTRRVSTGCPAGLVRTETCSASCAWEDGTAECTDECGGSARTTPDWAREICIANGPFMRGEDWLTVAAPIAEVRVSAFYIDAFPVTNRRYAACVAAGACAAPDPRYVGGMSYADSTRADHPLQFVGYDDAVAFCAWDGGRRLPTEAEWEKALRGPAPRTNAYPWDGPDYDCARVQMLGCGYSPTSQLLPDRYNGLPGSRGFYGTELQYGGGYEWTSDHWSELYFADPASRDDPQGPPSGDQRVARGLARNSAPTAPYDHLTIRRGSQPGSPGPEYTFRCARDAETP